MASAQQCNSNDTPSQWKGSHGAAAALLRVCTCPEVLGRGVWGSHTGTVLSLAEATELLWLSTEPAVTCQAREQQEELGRWDLVARAGPELGVFQGLKHTWRKEPELLLHLSTPTANFPFGCSDGTAPNTARAGAGSTCLPSIWAALAVATGGALVLGATHTEPPTPRAAGPATLPKTCLLASHQENRNPARRQGTGLCICWDPASNTSKMGPKPHDADVAPTRAGAMQDPALLPAGCLCCRPSLLRALQRARAALFWTWHHGTVTSLLHTSRHVALTASQQRLCGCPCTGRAPKLPVPKHRH